MAHHPNLQAKRNGEEVEREHLECRFHSSRGLDDPTLRIGEKLDSDRL